MIPYELIKVSSFQIGSVQLLAEVDPIALEPQEFSFLTILVFGLTDTFDSNRTLTFFNRILVFIEDASGKYLSYVYWN